MEALEARRVGVGRMIEGTWRKDLEVEDARSLLVRNRLEGGARRPTTTTFNCRRHRHYLCCRRQRHDEDGAHCARMTRTRERQWHGAHGAWMTTANDDGMATYARMTRIRLAASFPLSTSSSSSSSVKISLHVRISHVAQAKMLVAT